MHPSAPSHHALSFQPRSLIHASQHAQQFPHAVEGSSSAQQASLHTAHAGGDADIVLRSLYPSPAAMGSGGCGGFAPDGPVYRSVALESQQLSPAPFDASGLDAFDHAYQSYGHGKELAMPKMMGLAPGMTFVPMQQPKFEAHKLQLPQPTMHQVTQTFQAKPSPPVPVAPTQTATAQQSADAPPAVPAWLEPMSHFFCCSETPSLLFDTVQATLRSLHEDNTDASSSTAQDRSICTIDFEPTPARFRIACTAYQAGRCESTPFIVRIFTADRAQSKFCVEFQRRQGNVAHFWELFQTARTRIQALHPDASQPPTLEKAASMQALSQAAPPPHQLLRSWSAPPLPSDAGFGHSFSRDHICDTVRSLLSMCASPCIDIKVQGVLALAELSCSPSFEDAMRKCTFMHEALVQEGCCKFFLECLTGGVEHSDLYRASLTALANLSETQSSLCAQVVQDEKSLTALYRLSASSTQQVVRECARFLSNCASTLGHELMEKLPRNHKPSFCDVVAQLMRHKDAHCRKHACTIREKTECIQAAAAEAASSSSSSSARGSQLVNAQ